MLIFEALEEIKAMQVFSATKEQKEALEMAQKALEAQQRLCDMLNEFWIGLKEDDTFTARLTEDILLGIRWNAKFDEDGMFVREDEDND